MFGELGGHRLDEGDLVDHFGLGEVGKEIADPCSALATLSEGPLAF